MSEEKSPKTEDIQEIEPTKRGKKSKETEGQKQAFELYYNMGQKRSLEAVANAVGRCSRTIGEWSRRFKWADRIVQREIEEAANQGSMANAMIDAKAEYRKIIKALIATFIKDYKDGKIRIKNIQDFERIVKLDLMLLGDVPELEVKSNVSLTDEDRKAIFAVADSIKAEMKALKSKK